MSIRADQRPASGSSPLARGLPPSENGTSGFLPDHPRSRGVYDAGAVADVPSTGSSPLARGLLQGCRGPHFARGDHPRSRGVYSAEKDTFRRSLGSSPLARGLPWRLSERGAERGIIPARAGFTPEDDKAIGGDRDHPRSRGVYRGRRRADHHRPGSSPLARGLLLHLCNAARSGGIIPARAGFTRASVGSGATRPDHPRSRGVYRREPVPDDWDLGSSPLARGLRVGPRAWAQHGGIIPARAGFT